MTSMRRNNQGGQALLESSLVLLVCLALLIGTVDAGHFLYLHQTLTDRVRTAARYGAVHSYAYPGSEIKNLAVYNDPAPGNNAIPLLPDLTTDMVTAEIVGEGTDAARSRVTISNYPFRFLSPGIAGAATARPIIASVPYEWGL